MQTLYRSVFLILCLGLTFLGATAAPNRSQSAQVTFRDTVGDCVMSDDRLGGDDSVVYVDGVEGVSASFNPDGTFELELKEINPFEYSRKISYDFSTPAEYGIDGSTSEAHVAPFDPVGMPWISNIYATVDVEGGLEAMAEGSTAQTSLTFQLFLTHAFDQLMIRFDSQMYPGTSNATVTRTGPTTWSFDLGTNDVGVLLEMPKKRSADPVNCGYYSMPTQFVVEKL